MSQQQSSEKKDQDYITKVLPFLPEIPADLDSAEPRPDFHISTGSSKVDYSLGGGIKTRSVTYIYGDSDSGKDQFLYTFAVTCQMKSFFQGRKCLWIDVNGKFSPECLRPIAQRFKMDPKEVIKNVTHFSCHDQKIDLLEKITELFSTELAPGKNKHSLIIVDGLMDHIRAKDPVKSREFLSWNQSEKYRLEGVKFGHKLLGMAKAFNIAIIVASQKEEQGLRWLSDPVLDFNSKDFGRSFNIAIEPAMNKNGKRVCYSGGRCKMGIQIEITDEGIDNAKEEKEWF